MKSTGSCWKQEEPRPKPARFLDIMNDERGKQRDRVFESGASNVSDLIDDEALALALYYLADRSLTDDEKQVDEDLALAKFLQDLESESSIESGARLISQSCPYEKVTVVPRSAADHSPCTVRKPSNDSQVNSSAWCDAVALERKAIAKGESKLLHYARSEPLIQSLQTTEHLTELDGAGDLIGSKVLVGKTVAQDFQIFVHKQEKKKAMKKLMKSKVKTSSSSEN